MTILNENSLCKTLDAFNEALFFQRKIAKTEQKVFAQGFALSTTRGDVPLVRSGGPRQAYSLE